VATVDRHLPTDESRALLQLATQLATAELAPIASEYEHARTFPRDLMRKLGEAGFLSLVYPEAYGGGGQPYVVYLQVLEELAAAWLTPAMGISVHTLACHPLAAYGTEDQKDRWLPELLGGQLLGAYCLSEPGSGSDAAALVTRAERVAGPDPGTRTGAEYVVNGTKAWITHAGEADFYALMARTSDDRARGISCFLADAATPGLSVSKPERKMGAHSSPTAQVVFQDARVSADRLIGAEGQGYAIALSALASGRLGIAACAVGLARAAVDAAVEYATGRRQFGKPVAEFQGLAFMLADMATSVAAARSLYLDAARLRDTGRPFEVAASMAKLFATDMAMRVTTDAVQVFGGYGYVEDFPVERYMREAKVLQIVEGTNQIQRLVISRDLTGLVAT
jgi:alkylation response protein AidB-like acyl-CoA dehydrogenase